jgi:hypothetical protein
MNIDLDMETYTKLYKQALKRTQSAFPKYKRANIKPFIESELIKIANAN